MALWVLKGGSRGEFESRILQNSTLIVGWASIGDLSQLRDRGSIEKAYRAAFPGAKDGRVTAHVGQLYAFVHTAKVGDLVVIPLKSRSAIAIGEIAGEYMYRADLGPDVRHTRPVKLNRTDVPRQSFKQDLLYGFGAFLTFCQPRQENAEGRVRKVLEGGTDPGVLGGGGDDLIVDVPDVAQVARDQIQRYIGQQFKGHELAYLVEAILKAQGLVTKTSDPGPDGGVDILAASGPMGFDSPRLCVQVKSATAPVDVTVFRSLKGTMDSFAAEQGLLVAWGGFKDTVLKEASNSYFRVRLWTASDLIEQIFLHYEKLPEDMRAELPLKRVWALAREEPEE